MPLMLRARRTLAWLSINVLLNIAAASVIAFYQETLSQVIALAVFLPIISDMSGCSGNQAVAVSIRELSLGLVNPEFRSTTRLAERDQRRRHQLVSHWGFSIARRSLSTERQSLARWSCWVGDDD